jgi:hypothetical protein
MRRGAAVWLLLLLSAGRAAAHPVDEVVQGAYLTLAPGEVRLELDLTPGTAVSAALLRSVDVNGDRRITDAEARAYAIQVLKQSILMLDGSVAAWRLDKVSAPPYQNLLLATDTMKIYAVAARQRRWRRRVRWRPPRRRRPELRARPIRSVSRWRSRMPSGANSTTPPSSA